MQYYNPMVSAVIRLRDDQVSVTKETVAGHNPLRIRGLDEHVECYNASPIIPPVGTPVWCVKAKDYYVVLGPEVINRPDDFARVTSTAPVSVTLASGQVTPVSNLTSYTPRNGDMVHLSWVQNTVTGKWQGTILGAVAKVPDPVAMYPVAVVEPFPSRDSSISTAIVAIDSVRFVNGVPVRDERLGQGPGVESYWYYGGKYVWSTATSPAYLRFPHVLDVDSVTLTLHADPQFTGQPPAPLEQVQVDSPGGQASLPAAWIARLADPNDPAVGIGIVGEIPVEFLAVTADPSSGSVMS